MRLYQRDGAFVKPYYEDGAVTIYHGDWKEVVENLAFAGRAINAAVIATDPPFYLPARISTSRKLWPRSMSEVAVMEGYFKDAFTTLVTNALRPNGALYTFCDSTSYAVFLSIIYPLFDRTQALAWDKGSGGMGNGWRHSHELVLHAAFASTVYAEGFRRDVLAVSRVDSDDREHASEKPVELMARLIGAHPMGLVLDPFMGSGSTLVAAKQLGCPAIGVEIEERYCDTAARRLAQGTLGLAS